MNYRLLDVAENAAEDGSVQRPAGEVSRAILTELAKREKSINQPFRTALLDPRVNHIALCVGLTDHIVVFCIPPPSGLGVALYLWTPLDRVVACNGFFKWASPHLSIAKHIHPLVPPLELGTQYLFKLSEHSLKTLAEDMFNVDTMAKAYAARFAGIKTGKAMPTESETPALRQLQPRPGRGKREDITATPDLCP